MSSACLRDIFYTHLVIGRGNEHRIKCGM